MDINQQTDYKITFFRGGMIAAIFMVTMIPVQIACFIIWPHPTNIVDWFTLFNTNWVIGMISFDFLYMLSMIASIFLYIALFFALFESQKAKSVFALIIGLIGLTLYFPSNTSLEMLSISKQFLSASTEYEQGLLIASGQTLLSIWKGTSYAVYYVLNGIALILFFLAMIKSIKFRKSTTYIGLTSGFLMLVPATAGVPGMTMSLLSLIPWSVFSILVIQDFHRIIKQIRQEKEKSVA